MLCGLAGVVPEDVMDRIQEESWARTTAQYPPRILAILRDGGSARFVQFGRPLGGGQYEAVVNAGGMQARIPLSELERYRRQIIDPPTREAVAKALGTVVSDQQRATENRQSIRGEGKRRASNAKASAQAPDKVSLASDIADSARNVGNKLDGYATAAKVVGAIVLALVGYKLATGLAGRG